MPAGRTTNAVPPRPRHLCTVIKIARWGITTNISTMKTFLKFTFLFLFAVGFTTVASAQEMAHKDNMAKKESMAKKDAIMADKAPAVISLSQVDGHYEATALTLDAGTYIFEVTNRSVDKDLGFYLQDASEAQVANSGLQSLVGNGETARTGVVTLKPGTYTYSCPLNPTPHYTLTVK